MTKLFDQLTNQPRVSKVTITPEQAQDILGGNTHNRHLHERHVRRLVSALTDGRWRFNGESIKIARDGTLVDGQHRLVACVRTGIPIETLVVYGVDPDSYTTIDIGAKRTTSDALSREGIKNSAAIGGALRWILALKSRKAHIGNIILDPDQVLEEYIKLKNIDRSSNIYNSVAQLISPSPAIALHFLFAEKDPDAADEFFSDLGSGVGLQDGDPVLTLRNKLIEAKIKNRLKRHVTPSETVALVIRAWNGRRTGRRLSLIKGLVKNASGEMIMPEIE